jgi:hypothetical protein
LDGGIGIDWVYSIEFVGIGGGGWIGIDWIDSIDDNGDATDDDGGIDSDHGDLIRFVGIDDGGGWIGTDWGDDNEDATARCLVKLFNEEDILSRVLDWFLIIVIEFMYISNNFL